MNSLPQLTDEQRENVSYLISSIGSMNKLSLLWNTSALLEASSCLSEIHPARLLEHIGSSPQLREDFKQISKYRWSVILDGRYGITGLVDRCRKAHEEGLLSKEHVGEVFVTVGVAIEHFEQLIDQGQWGELVSDFRQQL